MHSILSYIYEKIQAIFIPIDNLSNIHSMIRTKFIR